MTARARTGIHAFVANACAIEGTIGIRDALGTATYVRVTPVFGQTRADAVVASCIRTARIQIAGIDNYRRCCNRTGITITERITGVSFGTGADGHVIIDRAQRSDAAGA